MVRSQKNIIGRILQKVGRALQSNPSKRRGGTRRTGTRAQRGRRKRTSGKGLLRRLLS